MKLGTVIKVLQSRLVYKNMYLCKAIHYDAFVLGTYKQQNKFQVKVTDHKTVCISV